MGGMLSTVEMTQLPKGLRAASSSKVIMTTESPPSMTPITPELPWKRSSIHTSNMYGPKKLCRKEMDHRGLAEALFL